MRRTLSFGYCVPKALESEQLALVCCNPLALNSVTRRRQVRDFHRTTHYCDGIALQRWLFC